MTAPKDASGGCVDRSLLRPPAVRLYFSRIFRLLPRRITANFVTLGAFGAALVVLAFAAGAPDASPSLLALVYLAGTQLYVAGDHLDGMQAVASDTTSPLGDFLDHFLDAVSGAILALAAVTLMEGAPGWLLPAALFVYLLAFTATYVERRETGVLRFRPIGTLEGIAVLSLFFGTMAVPGLRRLWNEPVLAGVEAWWGIFAFEVVVCLGTVAAAVRSGGTPPGLALYGLAGLTVAGAAALAPAHLHVPAWALVTLHGVDFLARVMQPEVHGRRPLPDPVAPLLGGLAALGWWLSPGAWPLLPFALATAWIAVRAAATVGRVLAALGEHWRWVNPVPEEGAGDPARRG